MYPIKQKNVIQFKLSIDFSGCDYSKGNVHATNEVMTKQWSKYSHLTSNAKCNCVEWKTRYATTWRAIFFPSNVSEIIPKWKYDYNSTSKPNASTVPMQNERDA